MSGTLKGASEVPTIHYLTNCPKGLYSTLDKGLAVWSANPLMAKKVDLLKPIFNFCLNQVPSSQADLDPRLWRRYCKVEERLKRFNINVDNLLREAFYGQRSTMNLQKDGTVPYNLICIKKIPTRNDHIKVDVALNVRNLKMYIIQRIYPTMPFEMKTARIWNGKFHQALAAEPHVVPILDIIENQYDCSSIQIFKYYDCGDVCDWINEVKVVISREVRWHLMEAIILQAGRLSKEKIYHRDIKLDNLVLKHSRKAGFRLGFTDFEFAVSPDRPLDIHKDAGTMTRQAPEFLEHLLQQSTLKEEYLGPADSWATGTVLVFLWQPYMQQGFVNWVEYNMNILKNIHRSHPNLRLQKIKQVKDNYSSVQQYEEFIHNCNTGMQKLIVELFNPDYAKRLTLEKAAEIFKTLDFAAQ